MDFGDKKRDETYSGATSKAPAPKPKYTPFTTGEKAKVFAALEDSLLRIDSFCCHELELKKVLLNNEELRPLMMRVGAVNELLDDLVAEQVLDSVSREELGILVLTPKYFKQFRHPQKMKSLGENDHHVSANYPAPKAPTARHYIS